MTATDALTQLQPLLQLTRIGAIVRLYSDGDRYAVRIERPSKKPESYKHLTADDALAVIVCTMTERHTCAK